MPSRLSQPTRSRSILITGLLGCGVSIALWVTAGFGRAADLSPVLSVLCGCIGGTVTACSCIALLAWRLEAKEDDREARLAQQHAELDERITKIEQNQERIIGALCRIDESRQQANDDWAAGFEAGRGRSVIPMPRPYAPNN